MDTFSFGVVLLELLTALPPLDADREGCDLVLTSKTNKKSYFNLYFFSGDVYAGMRIGKSSKISGR